MYVSCLFLYGLFMNVLFYSFYYIFFFIINILTFYSLFHVGSLSMGKGKADGSGLLSKLAARVSRSGRPRSLPPPPD